MKFYEILEFEGEIFYRVGEQWFDAATRKPVSNKDIQEMKNLNEDYSPGMMDKMAHLAEEMENEKSPLLKIYPPLQIRS